MRRRWDKQNVSDYDPYATAKDWIDAHRGSILFRGGTVESHLRPTEPAPEGVAPSEPSTIPEALQLLIWATRQRIKSKPKGPNVRISAEFKLARILPVCRITAGHRDNAGGDRCGCLAHVSD
jgi:hypothetical protein